MGARESGGLREGLWALPLGRAFWPLGSSQCSGAEAGEEEEIEMFLL